MADNADSGVTPDNALPPGAQKQGDTPPAEQTIAELQAENKKLRDAAFRLKRIAGKSDSDAKPAKTAEDEITARIKALEDDRKALNESRARFAIESSFADSGISGAYKKDAIRDFKDDYSHMLQYSAGGDVLVKASEIDEPVPVAEFIKSLVSAKKYDRFIPAALTPKIGPNGKAIPAKKQMTTYQYREMYAAGNAPPLSEIEFLR